MGECPAVEGPWEYVATVPAQIAEEGNKLSDRRR